MNEFVYLKNVVTLELDPEKCVGCGICIVVCPHEVFQMNHRRVEIESRDRCMECGACSMNCPTDALSVEVGVGCAQAVINRALSRNPDNCCCVIDPKPEDATLTDATGAVGTKSCC